MPCGGWAQQPPCNAIKEDMMHAKTYKLFSELIKKRIEFTASVEAVHPPDTLIIKNVKTRAKGVPVYSEQTLPGVFRPGYTGHIDPPTYPVRTKQAALYYYPGKNIQFKATVLKVNDKTPKPLWIDDTLYLSRFYETYPDAGKRPLNGFTEIETISKSAGTYTLEQIDYERNTYERRVTKIDTGEVIEHVLCLNPSDELINRVEGKD
jgi:hypothetical protein